MARTTATEVKEILDNSKLTDAIVDTYITAANALVTDVLENSGLGDVLLEEVERWLTAHMISVTLERTAKKEEVGEVKIEYTGTYGEQLSSTSYGQMVMTLDTTGLMTGLGGGTATIYAITSFE